MTWDSGGAIMLSSIITVILMWIGSLVSKHFGNTEQSSDKAHDRIAELAEVVEVHEREFLQYQKHVAETYARIASIERMESNIYASLLRLEAKMDKLQDRGAA